MNFNEGELIKIKKAMSGMFKKSARQTVAVTLLELRGQIGRCESLPKPKKEVELRSLLNDANAMRHEAIRQGARSYGHPIWAAAAASETWLQVLIQHQCGAIDDATLFATNELINDLIKNH